MSPGVARSTAACTLARGACSVPAAESLPLGDTWIVAADEATAGIHTTASVATAVVIHRHTEIDSPQPPARAWKRVVMTLPIASCSSNFPWLEWPAVSDLPP